MNIYITRHGKTVWNIEGKFQGAKDSPLTSKGQKDAIDLGTYLNDFDITHIFSSPIGRAHQTASFVYNQLNHKPIFKDDLNLSEMNFGDFEGRSIKEINELYPNDYEKLWNHPELFSRCPGNGESFDEVLVRVKTFLESLNQLDDSSNILIVTHGMYFVVLMSYLYGYERKDYVKLNRNIVRGCSLTHVIKNHDTYEIKYVGHDSYLEGTSVDNYIVK